jgi:hypothetical protein
MVLNKDIEWLKAANQLIGIALIAGGVALFIKGYQ